MQFRNLKKMMDAIRKALRGKKVLIGTLVNLPYDIEELRESLDPHGTVDWENFSKLYDIDHRIPASWFKWEYYDDREFLLCFDISNLKLELKGDNRGKRDRFETASVEQIESGKFSKILERRNQKNKYHVADKEARTYNGVVYHSKREAQYAQELDVKVKAGELSFWLRQVPFRLPGQTQYRLDFMTFGSVAGTALYHVRYIEVKGMKLRLGEIKRRQTEEIYGIEIEVV